MDVLLLAVCIFNDSDSLSDGVLALRHDFDESAVEFRSKHHSVLSKEVVLVSLTNDITTSNDIAWFKELAWVEGVKSVLIKGRYIDTTWDEHTLRNFGNCFQRSLNSVENSLEDT